MSRGSIRAGEIEKFDALAGRWWDEAGPMRALHAMNRLRVGWIAARLPAPVRLLDIGCGAGIASEALARLGHTVTGVDAAGAAIAAASAHARGQNLPLTYRQGDISDLARQGLRFQAITALEVIEHVSDREGFMVGLADLLEPGGLLVLSTINRTMRSLATAKFGAEYVLRLLPVGTHDWRAFVTPAELGAAGRAAGLTVIALSGMVPDLSLRHWRESRDLAVNYIVALRRPAA